MGSDDLDRNEFTNSKLPKALSKQVRDFFDKAGRSMQHEQQYDVDELKEWARLRAVLLWGEETTKEPACLSCEKSSRTCEGAGLLAQRQRSNEIIIENEHLSHRLQAAVDPGSSKQYLYGNRSNA